MRRIYGYIFLIIVTLVVQQVKAQYVEINETSVIADNWIQMIIDKYGHWGEYESAVAGTMQELRQDNRLIGYCCDVTPKGYIIISLRRELAPIKAYSDREKINFSENRGLAQLIKSRMLGIIKSIESRFGSVKSITANELTSLSEFDYVKSWDYIENYSPGMINKNLYMEENYQEGDSLLDSQWHQRPPYNNDCFPMGCTSPANGRALVGCVATAGAQIMKYWNWPPFGVGQPYDDPYDWVNMPDTTITTGSPAVQQAAVAEISSEVGIAVNMNYGCDVSTAPTSNMVGVYESNYRYDFACSSINRIDYTDINWFNMIKSQINLNRPIHYRIFTWDDSSGHSIVCDGWQEIGLPIIRQYHMNYGWDNARTTWYTLDNLHISDFEEEYMVVNIMPNGWIGSFLSGTYSFQPFPYRYFDMDAVGIAATFNPGQFFQTLPGITITGSSSSSYVSFLGNNIQNTIIYTEGDPSEGIAIRNGTVRLSNGGSIKLQ